MWKALHEYDLSQINIVELITSDLNNSNAIDHLEETLNQPQSINILKFLHSIDCECQCPFCYNPQCNLLDVSTHLVVGPWYAGDEDIKEEDQEEDDATAAMLVTVEEEGNIKKSHITEKQLTSVLLSNTNNVNNVVKK